MNFYSKIILFCGFTLFLHFTTFARDIYVDNLIGHNANLGHESTNLVHPVGPVRTISFALQLAGQGDRIILAHHPSHPYRETISLFGDRHSGDFEVPFTIEGNGAVLDGSLPISPERWTYVEKGVFRMKPSNSTFFILFLDGKPLTRVSVPQLSDVVPRLQPLEWCIFDHFIYLALDERKQPSDYDLSCTEKMTGITLTHVHRVQINDLAVQGYQIDGISAHNMVDNLVLDNVSIRGNGRYGLMAGKFSRIHLGFSRIGDNGFAQLLMDQQADVTSYQSLFFDQISPNVINEGGNLIEKKGENQQEVLGSQQLWDPILVVSELKNEKEIPDVPDKKIDTKNIPVDEMQEFPESGVETPAEAPSVDETSINDEPDAEPIGDDPFAF